MNLPSAGVIVSALFVTPPASVWVLSMTQVVAPHAIVERRSDLARNRSLLARLDVGARTLLKREYNAQNKPRVRSHLVLIIPVLAQDDKTSGTSESECADRFKASAAITFRAAQSVEVAEA